jgi:hypothetical protein
MHSVYRVYYRLDSRGLVVLPMLGTICFFFRQRVLTNPGTHLAYYLGSSGGSFPFDKAAGASIVPHF